MSFIEQIEVYYCEELIISVELSTLQFRMSGNSVIWLEIGTLPPL